VNFRNKLIFYGEKVLAPGPTPKLEDHPLSAVRDCLFNIFFAATLHVWRCVHYTKVKSNKYVVVVVVVVLYDRAGNLRENMRNVMHSRKHKLHTCTRMVMWKYHLSFIQDSTATCRGIIIQVGFNFANTMCYTNTLNPKTRACSSGSLIALKWNIEYRSPVL
jgi:hypothetical protein